MRSSQETAMSAYGRGLSSQACSEHVIGRRLAHVVAFSIELDAAGEATGPSSDDATI